MQTIDRPGCFTAEWGGYRIVLDNRGGRCLAEIRQRDEGTVLATMPELPPRTSSEAIQWVAQQLHERGSSAMIGGRAMSLADFLSFAEELN